MNIVDRPWYEDIYGMIQARPAGQAGGGNKPVTTAIYYFLIDATKSDIAWRNKIQRLATKHELEPGLFTRDPGNSQKQETWDNVLSWIGLSAVGWLPSIARRVFWRGVLHLGIFDTDMKRDGDEWLWRHVHIWPLAFAAGHRSVRILAWPAFKVCAIFMKGDHPGGIMLDWIWFYSWHKLGFTHPKLIERSKQLPAALKNQVDPNHPMVLMAEMYAAGL